MNKYSVKVPFLHGTTGIWPVLRPGIGSTVLPGDPNPRAVYTVLPSDARRRAVEDFAREAVQAKGGTPVVAMGKMDTTKGWQPRALTPEGRRTIGTVDDALDLIDELDAGAREPRRGEIWRKLQNGTGTWHNTNPGATLRPTKYRNVKKAYLDGMQAALLRFGVAAASPSLRL